MDVMDWGETEDYTINIISTTGIDEIANSNAVSLFPNPAVDLIFVDSKIEFSNFKIVNLFGEVMKQGNANNNLKAVDVADLAKGIYFIELIDSKNKISVERKIVKL
jgi:hypothetical protein